MTFGKNSVKVNVNDGNGHPVTVRASELVHGDLGRRASVRRREAPPTHMGGKVVRSLKRVRP